MDHTFTIIRPETLKELAYKRVKSLLISGNLDRDGIHSATQLADELGVSRTPVREALLQLSTEGFLEPLKGRGFRVRRFGHREISELFEARRLIENYVIENINLCNPDDLKTLDKTLRAMKAAAKQQDVDAFLETDEIFHRTLLKRFGNRLLASMLDNFCTCIHLLGYSALTQKGRMASVCREHAEIVSALRVGNAKAAGKAMRAHLAATERLVLKTCTEIDPHARDQHSV